MFTNLNEWKCGVNILNVILKLKKTVSFYMILSNKEFTIKLILFSFTTDPIKPFI